MTVTPDLDRRFREAAAAEGLLDVGFDVDRVADRPAARRGDRPGPRPHLLRRRARAAPGAARAGVRPARAPLRRRASTRRTASWTSTSPASRSSFELDVDLRGAAPFAQQVLDELARVPYGQTTTYGTLAAKVGSPRGARAVGMVMNRNPIPIVLPCHRVVGSNGSLTGYAGGLDVKERLLRLEGADVGL